jgi:hypothetical protein
MKKLLFLCGILLGCFLAKSQTLTPTVTSVCSGSTITLTGSGESSSSYYYMGNYENIVPSSSATKSVISETYYNISTGAPTKYVIQLTLAAGITTAQTVTVNMSMYSGSGGHMGGLAPTVPITVTIYPTTASQCVVPPPPTVKFNISSNNSATTTYSISENSTNIGSGRTVSSSSPNQIITSFNPYSSSNPYTQITPNTNSTVVMYIVGGHLPANAFINAGYGAISGTITSGPPGQETITFNFVNISTEPLTVNISLQ